MTTTQTHAPVRCEKCGSDLVVFEEHPDGSVIYCACSCVSSGTATNGPRSPKPEASVDAVSLKTYCSRCGKPRQKFDDWGGRDVIFLPCACQTIPAAPASVVRARLEREVRYCRNCHAALVVIGTRPDFTPIEVACPCQRPARPTQKQNPAAVAESELEQNAGDKTFLIVGAALLILAAALAGFWVVASR